MGFAFANHPVPAAYRRSRRASLDPLLRRALAIASAPAVLLLLIVFTLPGATPEPRRVEELPDRLARLILEEPAPISAPERTPPPAEVEAPREEPAPRATETPAPPPPRRARRSEEPRVFEEQGRKGRQRAQAEVAQQLGGVREELGESLESLSASLAEADGSQERRSIPQRRRGRRVRGGRDSAGTIATREVRTTGAESGSALAVDSVDLGAVAAGGPDWSPPDGGAVEGSGAGASTSGRSQSSLLAVVRRYAPGIRYCYDDALKSDASLRGKMVFSLEIAPDGRVRAVEVAHDDLGHDGVRTCALAQIRSWRFPPAAERTVFETPFVFRPPRP